MLVVATMMHNRKDERVLFRLTRVGGIGVARRVVEIDQLVAGSTGDSYMTTTFTRLVACSVDRHLVARRASVEV